MTVTERAPLLMSMRHAEGREGPSQPKLIDQIKSRRLAILLVDDTDEFRESMAFNLTERYDAEVQDVGSVGQAVGLLGAGARFDVIFLDLIMQDMNGVEAHQELRRAGAACRIVVMSAYPDSEEWERARDMGLELIEKPIAQAVLVAILSEL